MDLVESGEPLQEVRVTVRELSPAGLEGATALLRREPGGKDPRWPL